jgi:hypothetical protein
MKSAVIAAGLIAAVVLAYGQDRFPYQDEDPEIILFLKEAGVDFDHPNYMFYSNPWSSLLSVNAPISLFEKLLLMGARIEFASANLMEAIFHDNLEAVCFFLGHGADVGYEDRHKRTPLHEAAMKKNPAIVDTLIKAGADVQRKDASGWTPLHSVFNGYGSSDKDEDIIETLRILISHNADINAKNNDGTTVLMLAAGNIVAKPEIVRFLLQYNPDINAVNAAQKTALILAAANARNPDIITILLNAGANARLEDNTGRTALDWFDMNSRINWSPVRKELKDSM